MIQNKLEGVWTVGQSVNQVDAHTTVGVDDFDNATLAAVVSSPDCKTVRLMVSRVGIHSLYYAVHGRRIYWDEYEWRLRQRFDRYGIKKVPKPILSGQVFTFDGRQVVLTYQSPMERIPVRKGLTLPEAIDELEVIAVRAAKEMWETAGKPKVVSLLSGGTDSTLSTIALMKAGADVHAISVGVSPDSFDPYHARLYAEQLGIPFTFIQLPSETSELHALAYRAIRRIEMVEMSNVMMAMCSQAAVDWAHENDRPLLWQGYYADVTLGFEISTFGFGPFNKMVEAGVDPDEAWAIYRQEGTQHTIPNSIMLAKVCRQDTTWRSVFYHPDVRRFVWSMPLAVAPAENRKPLFAGLCDRYIKDGAWHSKKKVGFYTGAGIGTVRRENPVLQDENLRRIYRTARKEFIR
ncbi:hypothetical protein H10PHJ05_12 [Aeromonas phage HJ05]|nr:hypothetical protein H10PHJ05_12 [Aeromonas phage HJ05]